MSLYIDKVKHIYFYENKQFLSVSSFIHSFFKPFNADFVISNMMKSEKWSESQYFGMTKEEIKKKWKIEGETKRNLGTELHEDIENYFKFQKTTEKKEFKQFLDFHHKMKQDGFDIYKFETPYCIPKYELAGTVDTIYSNGKEYYLVDWKRVEKFKKDKKAKGLKCLSHIHDNSYNHYILQQNMYKYILGENGIPISKMILVQFHPNFETYQTTELEDWSKEINQMLEVRLKEMCLPDVSFGKYKGKKVSDLMNDKDYLSWCYSQPDLIQRNKVIFDYIKSCS